MALDVANVEVSGAVEAGWVQDARQGDVAAFGRLVRLYQRRAVSLAYRLVGNSEDAADVAQEAFVRAFRSLSQLEDATRFGPWLYRVVSNLAFNHRRSRKMRSAVSLDESLASGPGLRLPGSGKAMQSALEDAGGPMTDELRVAIGAALEQLPEKQRLALVLFSMEGLPQQEVAQVLDCSVELVKWNVFQARKKLKELLGEVASG